MHVDGKTAEGCASALRSLRTRPTTFAGSDIGIGTILGAPATVVELLACGAEIAVAFRLIGEPLGTVERTVLSVDTVASPHIRSDAPIRQPLQELPVPVGGVGRHRFWFPSLPLGETSDHVLCGHGFLAHAGGLSLVPPRSHSWDYRPGSCRSTPAGRVCHPWWRRWNRDPWSRPDFADAPLLPPDSAVPVPPDTGAWCGGLGQLPLIAPGEYDSVSPRSPPRSCHPPTGPRPLPIPLAHTAARSVQTTARTASTPESGRADSWKTWSDAGFPDRIPNL